MEKTMLGKNNRSRRKRRRRMKTNKNRRGNLEIRKSTNE